MKKIIKDPQNAAGDGRQENQTVKYRCCGKNKKTKTEITWVLRTAEAPVNLMLVLPLTPPSPYLPNIFIYNTRSNIHLHKMTQNEATGCNVSHMSLCD